MHATLLLALVLSADGQGPDPGIRILEADRSLYGWAYGYDWEYDDGADQAASSGSRYGRFDADVAVDLVDWWGYPVASSAGTIVSSLACDEIAFTLHADGLVEDAQVTQADGGAEGTFEVRFTLDRPGRVRFEASADGVTGYVVGHATLRADTPGPALAGVSLQGPGDDQDFFETVLPAGAYRVSGDLQAWAYGGSGADDTASGTIDARLTHHRLADLDLDGNVGRSDLETLMDAWGDCNDCPEDLNGDGTVDTADLRALFAAWGHCGSRPSSLGVTPSDAGDVSQTSQ